LRWRDVDASSGPRFDRWASVLSRSMFANGRLKALSNVPKDGITVGE
jgi:hypothetical protein